MVDSILCSQAGGGSGLSFVEKSRKLYSTLIDDCRSGHILNVCLSQLYDSEMEPMWDILATFLLHTLNKNTEKPVLNYYIRILI